MDKYLRKKGHYFPGILRRNFVGKINFSMLINHGRCVERGYISVLRPGIWKINVSVILLPALYTSWWSASRPTVYSCGKDIRYSVNIAQNGPRAGPKLLLPGI
jgi:hypothetical protein